MNNFRTKKNKRVKIPLLNKIMEKFLTNLIIKIAFGKGMTFKPEIRQIIEQLVTMSILIGCMAGTAISVIIALLVYLT